MRASARTRAVASSQRIRRVVEGEPTKDFFAYFLVKDIPLGRAILDLVDNSVDGALRVRGQKRFEGLWVHMDLSEKQFRIADNCGGIPVNVAEHYAFRFGRPPGAPELDRSLGRFGVGMKRAFFKLGNRFRVESRSSTERFVVEEDVRKWRRRPTWNFRFAELEEGLRICSPAKRGTVILVTNLHESVAEDFRLQNFRTALREEIEVAHETALSRGMEISLNGAVLRRERPSLRESGQLQPAVRRMPLKHVSVRLYAGVAGSDPKRAGWHVYCNDRLVLEADQSSITGWGDLPPPRFHPQYNRFRGYAFLDADDSSFLPWNTTKTGIDKDSRLFRRVRQEMVTMMIPVIRFLNRLDKAQTAGDDRLIKVVDSAREKDLKQVRGSDVFKAPPEGDTLRKRDTQEIRYSKLKTQVSRVKKVLGMRSATEVGEATFDYFYQRNCEE